MKSFNEFLYFSEEKITKGNYKKILKKLNTGQTVSGEKPSAKKIASDAALDDAIGRKRTIETLKQDRLKREYGTAGSTGDSNMGASAGGASGNKTPNIKRVEKPARNRNINIKHADSKVTFGQGIDTKKIADPVVKPTNPNTLNTIPGTKKKPSLWKRINKTIKSTYRDGGKGSGTVHKLGGALAGYTATQDDLAKGRSKPRAYGKGLTSFGSYMLAKPLSRIPKVGPIVSALAGDYLQRKSGSVYDKVADKVTGTTSKTVNRKSNTRGLPDVPMRGKL